MICWSPHLEGPGDEVAEGGEGLAGEEEVDQISFLFHHLLKAFVSVISVFT